MLTELDSKEPCSIRYVTADLKKMKGGEVYEYDHVVQTGYYKPTDSTEQREGKIKAKTERAPVVKNPQHYDNATRNLKIKGVGTRKVCIFLITHLNGKQILP